MVDEITPPGPPGPSLTPTPLNNPSTMQGPGIPLQPIAFSGDTLLQAQASEVNVKLAIGGRIELPPGRISIEELQELISGVIQKLKREVLDAETLDPLISERLHRGLALEAQSLEALYSELISTAVRWKEEIETKGLLVLNGNSSLTVATQNFNTLMLDVWINDRVAIQDLNAVLDTYNNLTPQEVQNIYNSLSQPQRDALLIGLTPQEIIDLGGAENAVVFQYINLGISNFNQYATGRPDVQAAIDDIIQATIDYNVLVSDYNTTIDEINIERDSQNLPPLPLFQLTPVPNPQTLYPTLPSQPEIIAPLIPSNATERLTLFLQEPTTDRTDAFKSILDAVPGVSTAQVNTAVSAAEANGPYATESAFFGEIRNELGNLFIPATDGYAKFDQALNNFSIRYNLELPNISQTGEVSLPLLPGTNPEIDFYSIVVAAYIPYLISFLTLTSLLENSLDLANSYIYDEIFLLSLNPLNFTLPFGYLDTVNPTFQSAANSIGGLGLATAAIGLQSRNLEIIMSRILFRVSAINNGLPISGRLFSRLQFSGLQLLSKSSLMSSLPAVRFLASRLGKFDSPSPAVFGAVALAFAGQIGSLVSEDLARVIVNGQVNRLGFYARNRFRIASRTVKQAQHELALAIRSGNPIRISSAVDRLTKIEGQLANATHLLNAFGLSSIGNFSTITSEITGSLNLSLLGISTAYFARALGIPNLVPLVFAQVTQLPPEDLLMAMTPKASLSDVLENPISLMLTKQTLSDTLVHRLGYSTGYSTAIVNNAINRLVHSGDRLNTLSSLRNDAIEQFRAEGLSPFHANLLASETISLIRGDLGASFLNGVFGQNIDPSFMAASLVNNLYGTDIGMAGSMLSNAVVRSLQHGGYGSRVRLGSELLEQFSNFGLNRNDASILSDQFLDFIETVGMAVPLNQFPGLTNVLLGDSFLQRIALGQGPIQQEVIEDLQSRGLSTSQSAFISDQMQAVASGNYIRGSDTMLFENTLAEAIRRSLGNQDSFETQREFRDALSNELSAVGFGRNDALFLANSAASYGVNGAFLSVLGISNDTLEGVNSTLIEELQGTGLSNSQANSIVNQAYEQSSKRAPFVSSADFYQIFKEEIFREIHHQTGRTDGSYLFDKAVAAATTSSQLLGLNALTELISNSATGILKPDLGGALASRLRDQILSSILGGRNIDEISKEEQRNPLSLVNLISTQIKRVRNQEDEQEQIRILRKLIQLLEKLGTPNAALGYILSSLGDNPGTFIGAVNMSEAGHNYQALQIPS